MQNAFKTAWSTWWQSERVVETRTPRRLRR